MIGLGGFHHAGYVVLSVALQHEIWETLFHDGVRNFGALWLEMLRTAGQCVTQAGVEGVLPDPLLQRLQRQVQAHHHALARASTLGQGCACFDAWHLCFEAWQNL